MFQLFLITVVFYEGYIKKIVLVTDRRLYLATPNNWRFQHGYDFACDNIVVTSLIAALLINIFPLYGNDRMWVRIHNAPRRMHTIRSENIFTAK